MNTQKVTGFFKKVGRAAQQHSPEILTGIGIAGMITTTILAVKATPKALEMIEEEKGRILEQATVEEAQEWSDQGKIPMSPIDIVKVAWKPYVPSAVTGIFSITCLIGATSISSRRNAALAAAYKLSETALIEFKEKAVEVVGDKKVKKITEEVNKDKIEKNPVTKNPILVTEKGNTLIFDTISGRYFKSDMDLINREINRLNARMLGGEMYVSLSQVYNAINLETISISDYIGWSVNDGVIEPVFDAMVTDDGQPCLVLDYQIVPHYDFDKLY